MGADRLARSFPSDRTAPRAAAEWFRAAAVSAGLPAEHLAHAEVCLDEVVTNVTRHARGGARPVTIRVVLDREPGMLRIIVEDDGFPFDPRQAPPPAAASSLEDAPVGGRGISLVRSIAEALGYERLDGRNRVTLVFRTGP